MTQGAGENTSHMETTIKDSCLTYTHNETESDTNSQKYSVIIHNLLHVRKVWWQWVLHNLTEGKTVVD
jgi:hypothetical protein